MNSVLTLVDVGTCPEPTRFLFNRNNTSNTNLIVDGQFRYNISTTNKIVLKTKIIDADTKKELVTIKKRIILSNKITFANRYGGKEQKLSAVLKATKLKDGLFSTSPVHMIQTDQGEFYWKIIPQYRLALFSTSNPSCPLAYRETVSEPNAAFALVINHGYESLTDYIIATFLVVEHGLRSATVQLDFT